MSSLMLVNPKKRKKRRAKKRRKVSSVTRRKSSVTRRYKRNPIKRRKSRASGGRKNIMGQVQAAVMPAVGALGLDIVMGYLPLPDALKTGPMRHAVKGAAAIGLGMLAGMVVKKSTAEQIAVGALTVTMYNAGRDVVGRFMPNMQLGLYEDDALEGVGLYDDSLGYYSAGYTPESNMDGLDLESGNNFDMYDNAASFAEDDMDI